jgi:SAM-dependent methyltransferase
MLPKGTVLDVAAGQGRNALYLASHGYTVEAIDHDQAALAVLARAAERKNLSNLRVRCMDLERSPEIQKDSCDAIVVFFFLFRPLVPVLIQALKPGGVLIYETFLIDNHIRHQHPRRREFCLEHNELLHLASGLRILYYDEGRHGRERGDEDAFTAQLLARKETQ